MVPPGFAPALRQGPRPPFRAMLANGSYRERLGATGRLASSSGVDSPDAPTALHPPAALFGERIGLLCSVTAIHEQSIAPPRCGVNVPLGSPQRLKLGLARSDSAQ